MRKAHFLKSLFNTIGEKQSSSTEHKVLHGGKKREKEEEAGNKLEGSFTEVVQCFYTPFLEERQQSKMIFKVNADPGEGNRDTDTTSFFSPTEPQGPETQLTNQFQDRRASALSCDKEDNVISKLIGFGYIVSTMRYNEIP